MSRRYWSPGTVAGRFVARRTIRSAAFWALIFGAYVASKSAGYALAYPNVVDRVKLAASFGSNVGFSAFLGPARQISSVAGFTAWNTLMVVTIVAAIWSFLLATRTLRGEETAGRWELMLAGQTTSRRATASVLSGLASGLGVLFAVMAITFVAVGRIHGVGFHASAAVFFALATTAGAAEFMAIGGLASQLMPTRSRAAGLSAGLFGASFLVRAMADTTSARWLLDLSPLGWIERLQPLTNSRPLWLIPITLLVIVAGGLTIWLAGHRDLGASTFADRDTARPRTALLGSPAAAAVRLTGPASLGWLATIAFVAAFFGLLTKSASTAFSSSLSAQHVIDRLSHATRVVGATTFLGIVFFFLMISAMAYAASAIGRVREDEAEGYLENLLVRPVGRRSWLIGRLSLIIVVIVVAGLIGSLGVWAGQASQHVGVAWHQLWLAGLNAMAPAFVVLGLGVLAFGLTPRLTSTIAYSLIAWSFLIEMVSSGLNLNHWLLDTSILHHVVLAPIASPNWTSDAIMIALAAALALIGFVTFSRRDIKTA